MQPTQHARQLSMLYTLGAGTVVGHGVLVQTAGWLATIR